jgi:hypothetical protein
VTKTQPFAELAAQVKANPGRRARIAAERQERGEIKPTAATTLLGDERDPGSQGV